MRIHVGTSGYNYPEWKGTFYPADLKTKDMFAFYAARFHTVEINYTFYRMPTAKAVDAWRGQAPDDFLYILKAPRRITHERRLQGCDELVQLFTDNARRLGPHLGPLLFQLPPFARRDVAVLDAFLALLPAGIRAAFEFRHDSWHADDVYAALERHGAALCIADFGDKTTPLVPTARHAYFRLRDEGYQPADLGRWVDRIASQADRWDDVFVFFKHEEDGKGPEFAATFVGLLGEAGLAVT
ncbi:MAG TPA: DUF72 domain-containing protein [Vicinamibacterales bacterium]|nr:DUF72 domain-containing protein [Vicinamibacterales bacterium]